MIAGGVVLRISVDGGVAPGFFLTDQKPHLPRPDRADGRNAHHRSDRDDKEN